MAVSTDQSREQWIDLGIHTEACMTTMTCGAHGGAVSMWLRVRQCDNNNGILTTLQFESTTGLIVRCER